MTNSPPAIASHARQRERAVPMYRSVVHATASVRRGAVLEGKKFDETNRLFIDDSWSVKYFFINSPGYKLEKYALWWNRRHFALTFYYKTFPSTVLSASFLHGTFTLPHAYCVFFRHRRTIANEYRRNLNNLILYRHARAQTDQSQPEEIFCAAFSSIRLSFAI